MDLGSACVKPDVVLEYEESCSTCARTRAEVSESWARRQSFVLEAILSNEWGRSARRQADGKTFVQLETPPLLCSAEFLHPCTLLLSNIVDEEACCKSDAAHDKCAIQRFCAKMWRELFAQSFTRTSIERIAQCIEPMEGPAALAFASYYGIESVADAVLHLILHPQDEAFLVPCDCLREFCLRRRSAKGFCMLPKHTWFYDSSACFLTQWSAPPFAYLCETEALVNWAADAVQNASTQMHWYELDCEYDDDDDDDKDEEFNSSLCDTSASHAWYRKLFLSALQNAQGFVRLDRLNFNAKKYLGLTLHCSETICQAVASSTHLPCADDALFQKTLWTCPALHKLVVKNDRGFAGVTNFKTSDKNKKRRRESSLDSDSRGKIPSDSPHKRNLDSPHERNLDSPRKRNLDLDAEPLQFFDAFYCPDMLQILQKNEMHEMANMNRVLQTSKRGDRDKVQNPQKCACAVCKDIFSNKKDLSPTDVRRWELREKRYAWGLDPPPHCIRADMDAWIHCLDRRLNHVAQNLVQNSTFKKRDLDGGGNSIGSVDDSAPLRQLCGLVLPRDTPFANIGMAQTLKNWGQRAARISAFCPLTFQEFHWFKDTPRALHAELQQILHAKGRDLEPRAQKLCLCGCGKLTEATQEGFQTPQKTFWPAASKSFDLASSKACLGTPQSFGHEKKDHNVEKHMLESDVVDFVFAHCKVSTESPAIWIWLPKLLHSQRRAQTKFKQGFEFYLDRSNMRRAHLAAAKTALAAESKPFCLMLEFTWGVSCWVRGPHVAARGLFKPLLE